MSASARLSVGCLVMAAGNAMRFGENKLTACFAGHSLFSLALAAIPEDTFCSVTVVSQHAQLLAQARQAGFAALLNDRPDDGVSRTIRLGTEAMAQCAGILYMVADQPLLTAQTVSRLVAAWRRQPECIVAAAHQGRRGNPCLFPARFFPELCALHGDRGGSSVIRRHEDALVLLETDAQELLDCDTRQALEILKGRA